MAAPSMGIWDSFLAWFGDAGPEVQAALIGNAGITAAALLTVVGTALFAIRQYRLERQERARDRALETKKEILFDSVSGGSHALACLASLTDLDRPVQEIRADFQAALAKITKASAAGNIATVAKGRDFLNAIGPRFIEQAVERRSLDEMHFQIVATQENLAIQNEEHRAILTMQRDAIASNDGDRAKQTNDLFQIAKSVTDLLEQQRADAIAAIEPTHRKYIRATMAKHAEVIPEFHAYIAAIRKDIGIDEGGPEKFLQAIYIDPTKPARVLDDALRKLDDDVQA